MCEAVPIRWAFYKEWRNKFRKTGRHFDGLPWSQQQTDPPGFRHYSYPI